MKCQIRWIDADGNKTTPDDNEATVLVRIVPHYSADLERLGAVDCWDKGCDWIPCCAEHVKRLDDPGMHHWISKPAYGYPTPTTTYKPIPQRSPTADELLARRCPGVVEDLGGAELPPGTSLRPWRKTTRGLVADARALLAKRQGGTGGVSLEQLFSIINALADALEEADKHGA